MAAYSFHGILAIALILALTIPPSLGSRHHHHHRRHHHHREENYRDESELEQDLRDICDDTRDSNRCWDIIKSELGRFHDDNDWQSVAGVAIDLARAKAEEIRDKLDGWHRDSYDDRLKEKYHSCSENYNDASRSMDSAKSELDSDDYQNIFEQVDDAERDLESCRREFEEGSFDPCHVRDRNNEFGDYVDIVKGVADRLLLENY